MSRTIFLVMLMKAGCPFWPYSTYPLRSIRYTKVSLLHVCMTCLALARHLNSFRCIHLTDSSLSASTVGSLYRRSFIMGFLKVLSWVLFSLPCTPSHCLILFPKVGAIIINLLTTLSFTHHRLHLTFIHWFTTSNSVLTLLGDGWPAIDWS